MSSNSSSHAPTSPSGTGAAARLADLARAAAGGDVRATTELLRALAPEMMRVVAGVLGRYSADAEDAMQQSLVALVHALPAFRGECAPAGYACRIAFRTALGVRKRARIAQSRSATLEFEDAASDDCPAESSQAARRTKLVRLLLGEIPPEQAEALALRTMLGWTLEEIAEASGAPVNTVRSRLRLAKEALRRAIEADPDLAEELRFSR